MEGDSEVDKCWLKDGSQPDDNGTDDDDELGLHEKDGSPQYVFTKNYK